MTELVNKLTKELNITELQANGGTGAIMRMAQENLGGDWSKFTTAVPGIEKFITHAPKTDVKTGLTSVVGGALGVVGMKDSSLASAAKLTTDFKTLNLDATMITKFTPIVVKFAQDKGGAAAGDLIQRVFKH